MPEKRQRAAKYHIATKDHQDPLVLLAEGEKDAAKRWAKRTGRKENEAVVRTIGTQAATITRPAAAAAAAAADTKTDAKSK